MICGCGNYEIITMEYIRILLANEMYIRGVQYVTE